MSAINLPNSGLGWDYRQSHNAPIPGAIGGYEHGGAQYLFLYQGSEFGVGDSHIHALRSTDQGLTWTDTDNVNIPQIAGIDPFAASTYTTCMDGNIVYLMAVDLDGTNSGSDPHTGPILLFKYNLSSNTFNTSSSVGGAPTVWKGWNGSTFSPRSGVCLHLLLRGAGDMLLLYTGIETIGSNQYGRIYVATFNGSSCGSGSVLAGQAGTAGLFTEKCAGLDASGNLHVILATTADTHKWYHVAMDSGGGFGTFQTVETDVYFINDTSNLLDFPAPADTIAFLGVRNRSSSHANGDLAIYSAPGGSLSPTWTFHNLPSTAQPVPDPVIAPDWIGALGYLDGTLHAFWTQTGIPPSWSVSGKMGEIRSSTAAATNLTTWTAETNVMGPFDSGTLKWGASQVAVWSGPGIGLGVLGNFEGFDSGGSGDPIEISRLTTVPPAGGGPPTVTCGSPPDGRVGAPYSHAMPSTHTGAFTVAVTAGALPDGLTMDATGLITGTPTAAGTFDYTATITDTVGTGTVNCSIIVQPPSSLGLGCASPPDGVVGVPYLHAFPVSGGVPPLTFSITSGILPPGLTLDSSNGEVSGTPTLAGDFEFVIQVSDDFGSTVGTCDITITVTNLPGPDITCDSPPAGEVGVSYSHTFPVSDITDGSTVAYSITGGALPPGLTLNTATGEVTGTPTTSGHYTFTITLTVVEPNFLTDAAGGIIYTTAGDLIIVT